MNWWKYSIGERMGRARRSVTLRVEPGGSPLNSCTVDVSSSLTHSALCLVTSRLFFLLFSRVGCCGDPGLVLGLLRLPGGRPRPRLTGTMAPGVSSAAGADPLGGGAGRAGEGHLAAAVESHRPSRSPSFRTRPKTNLGCQDKFRQARGPPRRVHLAAPVRKHTCLFLSRSRLRPRCRGRTRHQNRWSRRVPAFRRRIRPVSPPIGRH